MTRGRFDTGRTLAVGVMAAVISLAALTGIASAQRATESRVHYTPWKMHHGGEAAWEAAVEFQTPHLPGDYRRYFEADPPAFPDEGATGWMHVPASGDPTEPGPWTYNLALPNVPAYDEDACETSETHPPASNFVYFYTDVRYEERVPGGDWTAPNYALPLSYQLPLTIGTLYGGVRVQVINLDQPDPEPRVVAENVGLNAQQQGVCFAVGTGPGTEPGFMESQTAPSGPFSVDLICALAPGWNRVIITFADDCRGSAVLRDVQLEEPVYGRTDPTRGSGTSVALAVEPRCDASNRGPTLLCPSANFLEVPTNLTYDKCAWNTENITYLPYPSDGAKNPDRTVGYYDPDGDRVACRVLKLHKDGRLPTSPVEGTGLRYKRGHFVIRCHDECEEEGFAECEIEDQYGSNGGLLPIDILPPRITRSKPSEHVIEIGDDGGSNEYWMDPRKELVTEHFGLAFTDNCGKSLVHGIADVRAYAPGGEREVKPTDTHNSPDCYPGGINAALWARVVDPDDPDDRVAPTALRHVMCASAQMDDAPNCSGPGVRDALFKFIQNDHRPFNDGYVCFDWTHIGMNRDTGTVLSDCQSIERDYKITYTARDASYNYSLSEPLWYRLREN